jgi:hypothetical protein
MADIQSVDVARLVNALQAQSVTTLAGAIIIASRRPRSIDQAHELALDI